MFATIDPPPQRLLVFARVPELGRVKSRLAAEIGDEKTLSIYEAMIGDLLQGIGHSTSDTEIEVLWAPTAAASGSVLQRAFGDRVFAMQAGANLGDRLAMAFSERFFFHRTKKIIAIGVDDPAISREIVEHAFGLLESTEWVVGPATDGGYYLIGARAATFRADVFRDVEWGTPSVFGTTMARIRAWENTVAVLPMRYDIDVARDLQRFAQEHPESDVAKLV